MNHHFTDTPPQHSDAPDTAPSLPPLDVDAKREQIEENIRRLKENLADPANDPPLSPSQAPASNFDVLDYAKFSRTQPKEDFAEADPYVNTDFSGPNCNSAQGSPDDPQHSDFSAADTIDDLLMNLSSYQSEIEADDSIEPPLTKKDSPLITEQPADTVFDETGIQSVAASNRTDHLHQTDSAPIAWSEGSAGISQSIAETQEFDARYFESNVLEESPADAEPSESLHNDGQALGGTTSPEIEIPGADHDASFCSTLEPQPAPDSDDQLFVAENGEVVRIDGNDGFGYIDLACFDVQQATFQDHVIKLDDGEGLVFEVQHHNIPYALFADDVEVDLTADEPDGQIEKNRN